MVALPCQIHGLRKMEEADPNLSNKIACILGLYCNCNLEPNGHVEAIQTCKIQLSDVARFDFRGGGWPGGFFVVKKDGQKIPLHTINIKNVMNVMFRIFGAQRCYLCTDALAEYADLSFGDFWAFDYDDDFNKLERCTLVSQRSKRGLDILHNAMEDGEIILHELPKERASKRILSMAQGKKVRSNAQMFRLAKKGLAVPAYHYDVVPPDARARVYSLMYRFFELFRGPLGRKFILRILFSKFGVALNKVNIIRKNIFCRYHGN